METSLLSVDVSRVLFGLSVQFHYLFVPLTIGLAALVALFDTMFWRTGDERYELASAFWGRFFLVNFVCGVLTGIPLRWHLQDQWSGFATMAQQVLHHVFGIEGTIAPVMFTVTALFALRRRLPEGWRALTSFALALILVAQSLAILALNAWMQRPGGGQVVNGVFRLDDPSALFANPLLPSKVLHVLSAGWLLGGMFVVSVSALQLLRRQHEAMATVSQRVGTWFALVALVCASLAGHASGLLLRDLQPAKFAAIEGLWKPTTSPAPLTLWALPDPSTKENRFAFDVPGLLELVAGNGGAWSNIQSIESEFHQRLRGAWEFRRTRDGNAAPLPLPEYQMDLGVLGLLHLQVPMLTEPTDTDYAAAASRAIPPVKPVFLSFRMMLAAWTLMMALTLWTAWRRPSVATRSGRLSLWLCVLSLPLPWVASIAGWTVTEVGRQPWVITGVLTTSQALGAVSASSTALAIVAWGLVYACLMFANLTWSLHWIRQGPSPRQRASRVLSRAF
jgi:cytochrome d ubiquinol oxidase subunit I